MFRPLLFVIALFIVISADAQRRIYDDNMKELISRMQGAFDNNEQHAQNAGYANITLHIARIWDKRKDGYWLYSEQAMANNPDQPFHQCIYHVTRKDNETVESKVYEIPEPARFAGAWQAESKIKNLRRDSLIENPGCSIFLKLNDDGDFWGNTSGKDCHVTVEGASYLTSEVVIYSSMIASWDRAFDANDGLVWGPEKSGYRFRKWSVYSTRKD